MARKGFNSDWLWKQWARECREARRAIAEGRFVDAEDSIERSAVFGAALSRVKPGTSASWASPFDPTDHDDPGPIDPA